jgi:hypothetical protein
MPLIQKHAKPMQNGRFMVEDIYALGCSNEQLALVVPSISTLFSTLPNGFFHMVSKAN